jgi:hypothetical protein
MSQFPDRNLEFLNNRRIVYRRNPINDTYTQEFVWGYYYENGTNECYDLFRSKARITSYKSLKWHMLVILYLNSSRKFSEIIEILEFLSNKLNGFITFTASEEVKHNIIQDLIKYDFELSPKNKSRKIIFKEGCGLSITEKLSIVGSIIGKSKKINEDDIYDAMLYVHDNNEKITFSKLSEVLKCSVRTIHRNISDDLKKEKQLLNLDYEKVQHNELR